MRTKVKLLKAKRKSLEEERKFVLEQAERTGDDQTERFLRRHYTVDLKREVRWHHLAYGFIRGRLYEQMEQKTHYEPDWGQVENIVLKYGVCRDRNETFLEYEIRESTERLRLNAWLIASKEHCRSQKEEANVCESV